MAWRRRALFDFLFGEPLASGEDEAQKIGPAAGIPIFGLDALGSAAYGPEAALTILLPLGAAGLHYILPITGAIIALLAMVCFSYLQTIPAYPNGGGSYTVASQNLGAFAGLTAGAALMIDYVLTVAVGISAGVGALISAVPSWQRHTLPLCLLALIFITLVNLRGVRDTGAVFVFPTYAFLGCMLTMLAIGLWKVVTGGAVPVAAPAHLKAATEAAGLWLLLKAFSSGCTAMTGVEAVSNGVTAFRDPRARSAQVTLVTIIGLLIVLLGGIAVLCRAYGVGATEPGGTGYESVLSQLFGAVAGKGWFYRVSIGAIVLVLVFQANTAFADFPRLCRAIASDGYLPQAFANRGRRLVYTHGIVVLAVLSAFLLVLFDGITDRLIPLFAVGAFLAFTFSQAGMVAHWKRTGGRNARKSMIINGAGAIVTAVTVAVVILAKFTEGAWVTLILIPGILLVMRGVHTHYEHITREIEFNEPLSTANLQEPMVVVPIYGWTRISAKALRYALSISREVIAVHVRAEEDTGDIAGVWEKMVAAPVRSEAGVEPKLVVLKSPFRFVIAPLVKFVLGVERENPGRQIVVLIPNMVERHWYHRFLHNQRGELLTAMLLVRGDRRISVLNVPWYVEN